MNIFKKNGISLIILVIIIIIIIIISGSIILSLSKNNPISQASKATYLSDLKNFQTELELYQSTQFVNNLGSYNPVLLQADNDSITYNGIIDTSRTMNNVIPSLLQSSKYSGQFQVIAGKLIYGGLDTDKQDWTREAGLEVVIIGEPKITILAPSQILAERGTNIVYTVKFSSNLALTTINLAGKVEVLDNAGVALTVQPVIEIGTVSGTFTDTTRQVDITITTNNLVNGTYKLKIKPGVVINSNSISNTIDTISLIVFDIVDNLPPVNPTMSASPTVWTNGNVAVTIGYSTDSVIKEYSTNGTTWNAYTVPIVVSTNAATVYARGKDAASNESGVATLTVANIDKTTPVVTVSNGVSTSSSITVIATASDVGGSGIKTDSYQYSKDNGTTWTVASSATSHIFSSLTAGAYQCKVKVVDNALNTTISSGIAISTAGIGTITLAANKTVWTNTDVKVTITYPLEVVTKQYSINDGSTWNAYAGEVTFTANGTILAKGIDVAGNQTAQSSLTINNIVKDYSRTGLVLQYDGYTSPSGNIWSDLSGNGNNGFMSGFNGTTESGWNTNGIALDGIDDYIYTTNEVSYPIVTVQIIAEIKSLETVDWTYDHFISNYESGGYGFVTNNSIDGSSYIDVPQNKIGFSVYVDGYKSAYSNNNVILNQVYYLTGRYDGNTINLWINGTKQTGSTSINGIIGDPAGNQNFIIGGNPDGGLDNTTFQNMNTHEKIYAVRIYNRALTEDEINRNYQLDKIRFGL